MAAVRPRVHFTPEPDTLQAIDRLATFRQVPRSTIVSEYMGLITPALEDLADTLAQAHAAEQEAAETIRDQLQIVHDPLYEQAHNATHLFRALMDRIGRVRIEVDRSEGPGEEPPFSNTGVTASTPPSAAG